MVSNLHSKVREVLHRIYPKFLIKEEYPVKIGQRVLRLDFYVGSPYKIGIECQGEQHYKFVEHFHKNEEGFKNSVKRDRMKEEWCVENGVMLIYVNDKDVLDEESIEQKIRKRWENQSITHEPKGSGLAKALVD